MTSQESNNRNDCVRDALHRAYEGENVPPQVQAKLEETYARLNSVPQVRMMVSAPETQNPTSCGKERRILERVSRRAFVVAAASAAALASCGAVAYAVNRLLAVGPNEAAYFEGDYLPVYDNIQEGTASLSADVGESQVVDGITVTFDTVSADRNIVNLFFTLEQEGGFDLDSLSVREGSHEGEWARVQQLAPLLTFSIASEGEVLDEGSVRKLDAYLEDGKARCMMRVVPRVTLPDQIDLSLSGVVPFAADEQAETLTFSVGLDLSEVARPQELGAQDLVFQTSTGEKKLSIERFTVSDFGTVFVAKDHADFRADGVSYGFPDDAISPYLLKITDGQGNVLNTVGAGDGQTGRERGSCVLELTGLQSTEGGITFTPLSVNDEFGRESVDRGIREVDVTEIGAELPVSELGGYKLMDRSIEGSTVSISLRPYGWVPSGAGIFELIPVDDVSMLWTDFTDPETGITYSGGHSALRTTKYDYETGDLIQMDSYYAAGEEELENLHRYSYRTLFGSYTEEIDAALSVPFGE